MSRTGGTRTRSQALIKDTLYQLSYRPLVILCCAALSGCGTLLPKVVQIPVPVPCAPKDSPTPPKTVSNAVLMHLDDYHFILQIAVERSDLIVYSQQAAAIISACR